MIPVCEIFSTVGNNVPRDTMLGGERAGAWTHSGGKVMMETLFKALKSSIFFKNKSQIKGGGGRSSKLP